MKINFGRKKLYEIDEINFDLAKGKEFIDRCEHEYTLRVKAVADEIEARDCAIVMQSGPSASGKTTSALRIAREMKKRGKSAVVVSLDNFFKNITDYPKTDEGVPDMEHVDALDIDTINGCLKQLVDTGSSNMPTYDFVTQRRVRDAMHVEIDDGDIVIIEGIHALNPLLSQSIPDKEVFKLYTGLRAEYSRDGKRVIATRDLRITRRLVRDYHFRGHSVRNTLELWKRLMDGENKWIKPFKSDADMLLDTSFAYEPGLFGPILEELISDPEQGGEFRDILITLAELFEPFIYINEDMIPADAMLREFVGGLCLDGAQ